MRLADRRDSRLLFEPQPAALVVISASGTDGSLDHIGELRTECLAQRFGQLQNREVARCSVRAQPPPAFLWHHRRTNRFAQTLRKTQKVQPVVADEHWLEAVGSQQPNQGITVE